MIISTRIKHVFCANTIINLFVIAATMLVFMVGYPIYAIGGSLLFLNIIGIGYYISSVHKEISLEIGLFSLILFSIMGLNLLAYLEYVNGYSTTILIGNITFLVIVFKATYTIAMQPFYGSEILSPSESRGHLLRKYVGYLAIHMIIPFIFTSVTGALVLGLLDGLNGRIVHHSIFKFTDLSLIAIVIAFASLIIIQKRLFSNVIPYVIVRKSSMDITSSKKYFIILMSIIFVIGLVAEIQRGFWCLWIVSVLSVLLVTTSLWQTWKYVFVDHSNYELSHLKESDINAIPSLTSPQYLLRNMILLFLCLIIYCIVVILGVLHFIM